jgi:hypothetical protein
MSDMATNREPAHRRWTLPRLLVAPAVAIIVAAASLWLWLVGIPNHRLADPAFMEHASPAEIKRVAERALRTPWGNHHDACLTLASVGDAGSVPVLLRALAWQEAPLGDATDDTAIHCIEALRRLTGRDLGANPRDWRAWRP